MSKRTHNQHKEKSMKRRVFRPTQTAQLLLIAAIAGSTVVWSVSALA